MRLFPATQANILDTLLPDEPLSGAFAKLGVLLKVMVWLLMTMQPLAIHCELSECTT
jgi:hypothetical protein